MLLMIFPKLVVMFVFSFCKHCRASVDLFFLCNRDSKLLPSESGSDGVPFEDRLARQRVSATFFSLCTTGIAACGAVKEGVSGLASTVLSTTTQRYA